MKTLLVTSLITLLLLCAGTSGQNVTKPVLVDEFGELCSDDLRSRIDHFFMTISNSPNSIGYVVGHAQASLPGRYEKFVKLFKHHIIFRNFYRDRVEVARSSDREDFRIQFWIIPPGASGSGIAPPYIRSAVLVPTLFDASAIGPIDNGEVQFGGDLGGEPCDFGLQLGHFAKELSQQPNLEGHLVVTSDRRHSERFVRRVLHLTQKELTKTHGIRGGRIKFSYAGRSKESEMQLWMVPKGTTRPRGFTSRIPN